MNDADRLSIAVRNDYRGADDFADVCMFFDSLYVGGHLGILIVEY